MCRLLGCRIGAALLLNVDRVRDGRARSLAGFAAAAAAFGVVPWLGLPAFYESFLYVVFHWVVLATSWNILSGYSGYFSFGHGAFFGAGVYTTAVLAGKADVPFLWTLPVLFDHALPWLYVPFLAALLVRRAVADDTRCEAKYGAAWQEYRERVPYQIVPGIF